MGQKVSPIGMRVGIIRDWQSRWYADDKEFGSLLIEDVKIREFIENYYQKLSNAAQDKRKADPQISRIEIERTKNRVMIVVRTAHPGVVIGQDGKSIEGLKKQLEKLVNAGIKKDSKNRKTIQINVVEVANPNLDARLVARWIANELEQRKSFRATQKKAIQNTMRAGAKGIKTAVSGRLGGADMARTEGYSEGVVPLHTLRSDIDYAWEEAATTYGRLGVKVWICRGEVLPGEMVKEPEAPKQRPMRGRKNNRNRRPGGRAPMQNAAKNETAAPVENKGGNENVNA
ncbi:small subunit ribosomal protein S3 [Faecalicoccus acidiformans]|uniref:Small ribosomal subunit protein uS3 n=1 Tax=Faecalicoccus acidiformans TaxID=915173 RepID=A0A7W8D340_9FIRM|nr:30S ribosomal protein S3 [Faecalicoccus acidiformans]MBB5184685.1 small subunit ribosomal protein S3 [Faecalicoccus acidiformans]MDM8203427.1 30S ribosomal protein S3 [Faecalicoccus acidiformans]